MNTAGAYQEMLTEHVQLILLFSVFAFFAIYAAKRLGFFDVALRRGVGDPALPLSQVFIGFAIYVGMALFFPRFFLPPSQPLPLTQLVTVLVTLLFFALFCYGQNRQTIKRIWKDRTHPSSIGQDILIGALVWLLSFPIVSVIGQLADLLTFSIFGIQEYEQVAVSFLRKTLESPAMASAALFTILLAAPVIEEFLFRGLLQTWIRRYLGTKAAILIASALFTFSHFSLSQGVGNISLMASLFSFSCFLGFIYERQGSLFASISLHITFNTISSLRILLLSES